MRTRTKLRRQVFDAGKWSLSHLGPAWGALQVKRCLSRGELWTFTYHRIYSEGSKIGPSRPEEITSVAEFDEQLDLLGRHFNFVDGPTLERHFCAGTPLPDHACLITFDDAYEELGDYVDQIMAKHGAYGLVFVPPGFIETGRAYWWDLLQEACFDSGRNEVGAGPWSAKLNNEASREEALKSGCAYFHRTDRESRNAFLGEIESWSEYLEQGSEVLSWDGLRALNCERWGIGAHTIRHGMLMDMSYEEQVQEWSGAKNILEEKMDREIWSAAYPYGEGHQLVDSMPQALAASGLKAGFTQVPGTFGKNGDVGLVPRFGISARDDFLLKISGVLDWGLSRSLMGASR